ncbi:unnamed protein product [Prunus armeniaca]
MYAFPHKLLGLEKRNLHSHLPSLRPCGYKIGFHNLKVLLFKCVDVTDEVLEYLLSNCPVLEQLTVSETKSLVNIRVVHPSLESLVLDITGSVYDREHVFPTLANLKHLELILFAEYRLALHHLTSFLKASPLLQRLALKSATALEKIVIDPVLRWKYPIETYPSEMDRGSKEVVEEAKAREHAMQLVKLKLPSNVEFRFLLRIEKIQCQLGYTIMVSAIWSAQIGTSAAALKALWTIETHI